MARQLAARLEALSRRRLLALMAAVFAASRLACYLAGVRADGTPLVAFAQFLDLNLLRHRLAESVFYLHSQPPLFNVFLGIVVKLFPRHYVLALNVCYLGLGFGLYLALFALMRRTGASQTVAFLVSTWFILSPSAVLYENWLSYTLPTALLLVASGLLFFASLKAARFRSLFGFFAVVFILCTVWTAYHILYFLATLIALLLLRRESRRVITLAALLPLLLLLGLYVKNYVLFGQLTTSSWFGMNFSGVTVRAVPEATRKALVARGELTPLALIPRFSPLSDYPARYREAKGFENVPALREEWKPPGFANFNHLAYIAISREYLRNDLAIVRHHPEYLLVGWLNAWLAYFVSSSDYPALYGNLQKIAPYSLLYDYLCYGKVPRYHVRLGRLPIYYAPEAQPRLYLFLLVGLPLLLVFGFRLARRAIRTGLALSPEQRLLILYLCLSIAFLALVGNSSDASENQRFRFTTDPAYATLLALWIEHLRRRSESRESKVERKDRHGADRAFVGVPQGTSTTRP